MAVYPFGIFNSKLTILLAAWTESQTHIHTYTNYCPRGFFISRKQETIASNDMQLYISSPVLDHYYPRGGSVGFSLRFPVFLRPHFAAHRQRIRASKAPRTQMPRMRSSTWSLLRGSIHSLPRESRWYICKQCHATHVTAASGQAWRAC